MPGLIPSASGVGSRSPVRHGLEAAREKGAGVHSPSVPGTMLADAPVAMNQWSGCSSSFFLMRVI